MLIINVRTWLICSRQNARPTAGAVRTLEVAHAVRSMAAMKATRMKPTTEPASVSNHQQIRFWFFCWYAGQPAIMICCWFFFPTQSFWVYKLIFVRSLGVLLSLLRNRNATDCKTSYTMIAKWQIVRRIWDQMCDKQRSALLPADQRTLIQWRTFIVCRRYTTYGTYCSCYANDAAHIW